jgi:hypothetical protein
MSGEIHASKVNAQIKRCLVYGKKLPAHSGENLCREHQFTLGEIWQLDANNWTWRKIKRKIKTEKVGETSLLQEPIPER